MAPATKTQGKTSFVKEFLEKNPRANSRAVNEAWAAAGMKGTISHTVVSEARKQLGLLGNQSAKPRPTDKAAPARKQSKPASRSGKTMFVKEFLYDNPASNVAAVNAAWQAAGFDGTISPTVINKTRALLGLTGNIRANTQKSKAGVTEKKPGRPRTEATAAGNSQPQGSNSTRTVMLNDLEADIDRLMFKAMAIGDLAEIEDSLRRARRLLYGALDPG